MEIPASKTTAKRYNYGQADATLTLGHKNSAATFKEETFSSPQQGQPDTAASYWSHPMSGPRSSLASQYFCCYRDMPMNGFIWEMFLVLGNKSWTTWILWDRSVSFQRENWGRQGEHQPKATTASAKGGWEILSPGILLIPTGNTGKLHGRVEVSKKSHHCSIRSYPMVELSNITQCIGRGLTSLGKKSTGVIHAQPLPPLRPWDDHFLHSHIYLESDNSLPQASCWSLSSIVQDLHYSTGNQWEVQWLERCVSHSDPPLLSHLGLEVGHGTQLCPWELRELGNKVPFLLKDTACFVQPYATGHVHKPIPHTLFILRPCSNHFLLVLGRV